MSSKILLFDFDGTIADTLEAGVRIYNEIARRDGLREISKEVLPTLRNHSALENVRLMGVPMLKLPLIAHHVRAAMKKEVPHFKAIEGVAEPLRALKAKGYQLFIVSSNSQENIHLFLEHNDIDLFEGVYSVSDLFGKHHKMGELIRDHGWSPGEVMYIGDEVRDIEAARKAGVASVAVAWGYNTHDALARARPDVFLNNPIELAYL